LQISHTFSDGGSFRIGIEEELLLVEPPSYRLAHASTALLRDMKVDERAARHDIYEAQVELSSPPSPDAASAAQALGRLRRAVVDSGASAMGAGLHPAGEFGDVRLVDAPRYEREAHYLRGLLDRTPDCALHVHVGLPDAETAIRVCNGFREWLPLLEALAGNSPFWHGRDSGFASARRILRRGFPRVDIPDPFADWDDWEASVRETLAAGDVKDYTLIWWEVRPHPRYGTVEVRAMDSQSSLPTVAGLAALVQGLAKHLAELRSTDWQPRGAVAESSYRAGRFGLEATLYRGGELRPARDVVAEALALAGPHLRELGAEAPLEEVERLLREGNGADRQRAAHGNRGMLSVLEGLARETMG
jgi:glutamate---cysteine ligase / carboxylate-amine ligase